MRTLPILLALVPFLAASPAAADDLLPPGTPIEQAVDLYIDARLREEKIAPAPQADDATLARRLTLDLAGRIPVPAETRAFVESREADKRVRLVDRLVASPAFIRHQADEFDAFLMAGTRGSLREYLGKAMTDNRPWDRIFRELLLPDEKDAAQKGATVFLRERAADTDKLTADVSILFFGVNIGCARCHDHPLVPAWKQDHFFGMKSFFSRTALAGQALVERDTGPVKFKTTKGIERTAKMMFLTGTVLDVPAAKVAPVADPKPSKDRPARQQKQPPILTGPSTRAQLVDVALRPGERDFFARAVVNRVWYRLFGRGLVMPLDQMHSENPSSHPELLAWLARDLGEHGYDLRRLVRGLVLSRAYSRGSRWENGDPPRPQYFAFARLRALTPMQLAASLRVAASDPRSIPAPDSSGFEKWIEGQESAGRGFASLFEQPHDDFQIGVSEALLFSNSDRILREFSGGDRLPARLEQTKDQNAAIDLAVSSVLCRPPTAAEQQSLRDYLARRTDRPADAWRQVVWVLLTSPEFRFNH
jgi:hypothetical protein